MTHITSFLSLFINPLVKEELTASSASSADNRGCCLSFRIVGSGFQFPLVRPLGLLILSIGFSPDGLTFHSTGLIMVAPYYLRDSMVLEDRDAYYIPFLNVVCETNTLTMYINSDLKLSGDDNRNFNFI